MDSFFGLALVAWVIHYSSQKVFASMLCVAVAIAEGQPKEVQEKIEKEWDKIGEKLI